MTAPSAHLSTDRLADLAGDVLEPDDARAVHAHLAVCPDCTATYERLVEVPALLSTAARLPIPVDVAGRVSAAIEREQLSRAAEAERDHAAQVADRAPARRRFAARLGAGLLGATAVLGGGYLVLSNGVISTDLGLGGGAEDASPADGGSVVEESLRDADAPASTEYGVSGAYTAATLDDDARTLLASSPLSTFDAPSQTRATGVPGEDGEVGEPGYAATKARACIAATQGEARTEEAPLAVDIGTYDGVDAVVILLPEKK